MKCPDQVVLLPGVVEALLKLIDMEYELVVISNQSGIGRGLITEGEVIEINHYLSGILQSKGIFISAFYFCPHHPDDCCQCRKPKPGMILRALSELAIDKKQSYMAGDKSTDAEAGLAAGVTSVFISKTIPIVQNSKIVVCDSLLTFANYIDRVDII